ncbi:MAG: protein kinase, partial [Anaerolineae bacterium]|nr:protein kinase [Anaerolineae bacterium]
MVNSRYILHDAIGEGAMGVIYRAYDRLMQQFVALKRVKPDPLASSDSASQSNQRHYLTAITQEFQLLSSLRHPNIISVLDYGIDADKTPYYVMELLAEADTILTASQNEPFNQRIHYLIEALRALEYLHRRGILHRDLKPANILITDEKVVKVLDFGLATFKKADNTTALTGTLAYMPPEVLKGVGAVEQSDLYALGIVAYQMFVGKHPFDSQDVNQMIYDTVSSPPPLDPLTKIHPQLAVIIGQLLEKSPDARYPSAYAVIIALSSLIQTDIPAESLAVRESFLQASQLIGRDVEMNALIRAYQQSKTESVRLIFLYGESGVGKSRVLDEVRIRVLIDNSLVLRGYANPNELHPFGIWREPLRQLCLIPNLVDDSAASILKPLIPDMEALLNRPVADAPALSGMADLNRMIDVIVQLILAQAERRQTVILLEDVHDAPDTLPILRRVNSQTHVGLFMVVTSQPTNTFHKQLDPDEAVSYELARLNSDQIAELLENVIGGNSQRPDVVQLLEQETEGNLFFLIETLKVLAEDAGTLSQIGNVGPDLGQGYIVDSFM